MIESVEQHLKSGGRYALPNPLLPCWTETHFGHIIDQEIPFDFVICFSL